MDVPRFGVNYVPSTGWWYSWIDWNDGSVREDLAAIAGLGCDHVRVHCLWPVFQPNATLVSAVALDRLESLLQHADAAGLDVVVTVLDGWLSGFDFRPAWLGEGTNMFTDPEVVRAQRELFSAVAARIGTHPRFLGFDVANEPDVLVTPRTNRTTRTEGDLWVTETLAHCEAVAPGALHSVGMDHRPWLTDGTPFGRPSLARTGTVTPVHAWTFFTGALERYGEFGTGCDHLAEYMLELAKAHHVDPVRKVWLQEYGMSPEWASHREPGDFVERATAAAVRVADLWGVTWWCSHDIDRRLSGFSDLEYDLGLLTVRNEVKPSGARFQQMVQDVRSGGYPVAVARPCAVVLPDGRTPDLSFADAFFGLVEEGVAPTVVLESRAADRGHLVARGITRLVEPG